MILLLLQTLTDLVTPFQHYRCCVQATYTAVHAKQKTREDARFNALGAQAGPGMYNRVQYCAHKLDH